jgi:hypothetical protein
MRVPFFVAFILFSTPALAGGIYSEDDGLEVIGQEEMTCEGDPCVIRIYVDGDKISRSNSKKPVDSPQATADTQVSREFELPGDKEAVESVARQDLATDPNYDKVLFPEEDKVSWALVGGVGASSALVCGLGTYGITKVYAPKKKGKEFRSGSAAAMAAATCFVLGSVITYAVQ